MSERPSDPWSTLGLEVGTLDAKAIRRAYAVGLRVHPPDGDPAGFRALREAYEQLTGLPPELLAALAQELRAGRRADPADAVATSPASADAAPATPAAQAPASVAAVEAPLLAAWRAELAAALPSEPGGRQPSRALVADALERVVAAARRVPGGPAGLAALLDEPRDPAANLVLAQSLPPTAIVGLLADDEIDVLAWAAQRLLEGRQLGALADMAQACARRSVHLTGPRARRFALQLGQLAAPLAPFAVRQILEVAWTAAPPEERRQLPAQALEQLCAIGAEAAAWPSEEARQLLARALVPRDLAQLVDEEDMRVLAELCARQQPSTLLVGAVMQRQLGFRPTEEVATASVALATSAAGGDALGTWWRNGLLSAVAFVLVLLGIATCQARIRNQARLPEGTIPPRQAMIPALPLGAEALARFRGLLRVEGTRALAPEEKQELRDLLHRWTLHGPGLSPESANLSQRVALRLVLDGPATTAEETARRADVLRRAGLLPEPPR